jgi:hypothetical protein
MQQRQAFAMAMDTLKFILFVSSKIGQDFTVRYVLKAVMFPI